MVGEVTEMFSVIDGCGGNRYVSHAFIWRVVDVSYPLIWRVVGVSHLLIWRGVGVSHRLIWRVVGVSHLLIWRVVGVSHPLIWYRVVGVSHPLVWRVAGGSHPLIWRSSGRWLSPVDMTSGRLVAAALRISGRLQTSPEPILMKGTDSACRNSREGCGITKQLTQYVRYCIIYISLSVDWFVDIQLAQWLVQELCVSSQPTFKWNIFRYILYSQKRNQIDLFDRQWFFLKNYDLWTYIVIVIYI